MKFYLDYIKNQNTRNGSRDSFLAFAYKKGGTYPSNEGLREKVKFEFHAQKSQTTH